MSPNYKLPPPRTTSDTRNPPSFDTTFQSSGPFQTPELDIRSQPEEWLPIARMPSPHYYPLDPCPPASEPLPHGARGKTDLPNEVRWGSEAEHNGRHHPRRAQTAPPFPEPSPLPTDTNYSVYNPPRTSSPGYGVPRSMVLPDLGFSAIPPRFPEAHVPTSVWSVFRPSAPPACYLIASAPSYPYQMPLPLNTPHSNNDTPSYSHRTPSRSSTFAGTMSPHAIPQYATSSHYYPT